MTDAQAAELAWRRLYEQRMADEAMQKLLEEEESAKAKAEKKKAKKKKGRQRWSRVCQ